MSYSRRQLESLGEPFGECATRPKLGGGYVCGGGDSGGGGGGQQAGPTTNTSYSVALQPELMPYGTDIAAKSQALASQNYTPYVGQRTAGFNPMQQGAFQSIGNMTTPQQGQDASSMAYQAGVAALNNRYNPSQFGVGGVQNQGLNTYQMGPAFQISSQNFGNQAAQDYMSPYMQNVVDYQKTQAEQDLARRMPGMNAAAVAQGAFGGNRQAIQGAEAQRNLQNQFAGIQAQGTQQAYQQGMQQFNADQARNLAAQQANQGMGFNVGQQNLAAALGTQQLGTSQNLQAQLANQQSQERAQQATEQSRQYGAGFGLQSLGQANQAAQTLGQLGQAQFQQQMNIDQAKLQAGGQQQQQEQQGLSQQYQDFLKQKEYPYSQMAFYNSMIRGLAPVMPTTTQTYTSPPSTMAQLGGMGLGAYALGKMMT